MSSRVLITGASGFIGYHLIEAAQKEGLEVHAAVRRSSNVNHLRKFNPVFVYPALSDKEALKKLLKDGNYSYIIHAAGATRAKNTQAYNLINADYTRLLAEAALEADIPLKRFLFMSSLAALGPLSYAEEQPITENTLPLPITSYGKSKLLAEKMLEELTALPLTTIRPTAVYGPREKDLFILFKTLNQGLDAYIGKEPQRLSFVYVKDLAEVTVAALLKGQNERQVYNISDGFAYDRYALADAFKETSGKKPRRIHLPVGVLKLAANIMELGATFSSVAPVVNREKVKELTAPNWFCSIEAAKRDLQYQPHYNLNKGIAETWQWYKANDWI
ncbi:NAD-dependent epimerase/dehydratase family protein [Runella salmonicolor]|uniref:NAD-dependent epimerase/dehydratase family protein n=1 Tax=Runella salmonicolor TaxID=2950278 RepID=A0ABT1FVS3_9BACT|nr:NAD-dependent epimerase/dehydratase family protein [Runella salmonicolor]MCP1385861.1 NAD-dependent epimerase/dehydratase family protein [Runella salmonicolor]